LRGVRRLTSLLAEFHHNRQHVRQRGDCCGKFIDKLALRGGLSGRRRRNAGNAGAWNAGERWADGKRSETHQKGPMAKGERFVRRTAITNCSTMPNSVGFPHRDEQFSGGMKTAGTGVPTVDPGSLSR
jgi:hypothetical protein